MRVVVVLNCQCILALSKLAGEYHWSLRGDLELKISDLNYRSELPIFTLVHIQIRTAESYIRLFRFISQNRSLLVCKLCKSATRSCQTILVSVTLQLQRALLEGRDSLQLQCFRYKLSDPHRPHMWTVRGRLDARQCCAWALTLICRTIFLYTRVKNNLSLLDNALSQDRNSCEQRPLTSKHQS